MSPEETFRRFQATAGYQEIKRVLDSTTVTIKNKKVVDYRELFGHVDYRLRSELPDDFVRFAKFNREFATQVWHRYAETVLFLRQYPELALFGLDAAPLVPEDTCATLEAFLAK